MSLWERDIFEHKGMSKSVNSVWRTLLFPQSQISLHTMFKTKDLWCLTSGNLKFTGRSNRNKTLYMTSHISTQPLFSTEWPFRVAEVAAGVKVVHKYDLLWGFLWGSYPVTQAQFARLQKKGSYTSQWCQVWRTRAKLEMLPTDKMHKTAGDSLQRGRKAQSPWPLHGLTTHKAML